MKMTIKMTMMKIKMMFKMIKIMIKMIMMMIKNYDQDCHDDDQGEVVLP